MNLNVLPVLAVLATTCQAIKTKLNCGIGLYESTKESIAISRLCPPKTFNEWSNAHMATTGDELTLETYDEEWYKVTHWNGEQFRLWARKDQVDAAIKKRNQ